MHTKTNAFLYIVEKYFPHLRKRELYYPKANNIHILSNGLTIILYPHPIISRYSGSTIVDTAITPVSRTTSCLERLPVTFMKVPSSMSRVLCTRALNYYIQ